MKPMFILNRNEEIVAILSGNADDSACHFFNSNLTLEINKGASLTFEVDTTEADIVQYIKEENMVVVHDGENYRLLIIKEISDVHEGEYIKEVYCEDASAELIDEIIYDEIEGKIEMGDVLATILNGTRWQVGEVDNTYIRNLKPEFKLKSVLNGIQNLASQYGAEIDFTVEFAGNKIISRKVHMKKAFGRTLGKRFEFGKDVTSIKRTVNTADIKTAVVPFGATNEETGEALTIREVTWTKPQNPFNKPFGQTFLEDTDATELWGYKGTGSKRRARWIAITFEDCNDANELINYAQLQLNRFNKPKVSYEASVVDLFRMTGDDSYSFEKVGLGDMVNIIDHEFVPALALTSRVVKLELDLNDTSNSKVTLGTVIESIVDKDLKTQIEELNVKVGAVSKVDLSDIEDRLDILESETGTGQWEQIQEVNNLLFGNGVGYHYMSEDNGIWVFDKPANQNPTKAVALKGGMIGLAKYDAQKQKWNVGTFIDGNQVNASMITTGTLKADRIEANALTVNHFNQELKSIINSVGDKPSREEVTTSIQTAVDNITLSVKNTYATKSEAESMKTSAVTESKKYSDTKKEEAISEAVQSANEYADEKKDEAVAEAGENTQAKVDAVKTTLTKQIELKASKTDVYTKTETYSKAETDAKIQVAKESIELSVSGTYETKTNVENKVNTAKSEAILSAVQTSTSYADEKKEEAVAEAVDSSNAYADDKKTEAITSANNYADNKKAEAIAQAGKDADSKIATAKTELNGKIDLKASKTDVYTKSETYTKAQTDSAIKVAKDEINLGVSNTYETKTNVESKVSTAKTEAVNTSKSYADTKKAEAISTASTDATNKVNSAKNELNTKIDGIQIGGRNLWRFTKEYDGTKYNGWVDNNNNGSPQATVAPYTTVNGFGVQRIANAWHDRSQRVTIEANANYTLSAWIKWENTAGSMIFYTNTGTMSGTDVTSQVGTTDYKRVSITFNSGNATVSTCRFECNSNTPYLIYGLKLEKGTKATDWTPAPEDVDSAINKKANSTDVYTKSQVYTKEETNSQINIAKDNINLGISNTYETKANVESKVTTTLNSAKNYADTKKSEAISTASTDATNKVNSAKNELNTAINKKANSVDVYKKSETYTKTETDSKIKVAQDNINLSVSQTYETKTNVETKVNNAVDGIKIGAKNLFKDTKDYGHTSLSKWNNIHGTISNTSEVYNGCKVVRVTSQWGRRSQTITCEPNTEYVISAWVKGGNTTTTINSYCDNASLIKQSGIGVVGTSWKRVWAVWRTSSTQTNLPIRIEPTNSSNCDLYICGLMVEKANKPSDWSPAPEDIDSAIGTKANASDVYNKTEVYTKAETNSQINVAKDEINLGVSSTYETKTNVETKVNNAVNNIQVGGRNLALNTSNNYSTAYSNFNGSTNTCPALAKVLTDGLKVGDTVTVRLLYKYTNIVATSGQTAKCWIQGYGDVTAWNSGAFHSSPQKAISGSGEHEFKYSFTVIADHLKNEFWNTSIRHDYVQSGSVQWKLLKIERGNKATDWTPAPEDLEKSIELVERRMESAEQKITPTAIINTVNTQIGEGGEINTVSTVLNKEGLTVNNGALRVKNKAGKTVLEGDSNGNLVLSGTLKSESSNGLYASLSSGGLTLRDSQKNEEVLRVNTSFFESNRDMNGVTFAMPQYADFMRFSHIAKPSLENGWSSSDTTYKFMDFWSSRQTIGSTTYDKGIHTYAPIYARQKIHFKNSSQFTSDIIPNLTWNSISDMLGICGDNGLFLGYRNGETYNSRLVLTEGSHPGTGDNIRSWGNWNCSGYTVHNGTFSGNHVNSYANTYTRTSAQTHCIEAEQKQVRVNFEDVQITEGKAILNLPRKYTGIHRGYIVSSIVKKGRGDVWVSEESENRFILEGTDDIKVNVEVVIKLEEASAYSTRTADDSQLCFDMSTGQPIS